MNSLIASNPLVTDRPMRFGLADFDKTDLYKVRPAVSVSAKQIQPTGDRFSRSGEATTEALSAPLTFGAVSRRGALGILGGLGAAALLVACGAGSGDTAQSAAGQTSAASPTSSAPPGEPSETASPSSAPESEPDPLRGNYVIDDGATPTGTKIYTVSSGDGEQTEAGSEAVDGSTLISVKSDKDNRYHITSILGKDGWLYQGNTGNIRFARIEENGDGAKITLRNHDTPAVEVRREGDTYRLLLPTEIGGDNPTIPVDGVDAKTAAAVLLSAWQPSRQQITAINRLYNVRVDDLFRNSLLSGNANDDVFLYSPDKSLRNWDNITSADNGKNRLAGFILLRLNLQATRLTTDLNPSSRWHLLYDRQDEAQPYRLVWSF